MARGQARVTERLLLVDWHANNLQLLLTAFRLADEQSIPGLQSPPHDPPISTGQLMTHTPSKLMYHSGVQTIEP